MSTENWGKVIQRLRKERHLTAKRLAERSGLDYSYVRQIEAGLVKEARLTTFARLAEGLEMSLDELKSAITGEPAKPRSLRSVLIEAERLVNQYEDRVTELPETIYEEPPLVAEVSAGTGDIREQIPGTIANEKTQLFRLLVHGESLQGDNIHDGYIVVVRKHFDFIQDLIYVVNIDSRICLRHVTRLGTGMIRLWSSNSHFQEQVVKEEDIIIQGQVVKSYLEPDHLRRL
jgi:transcriptional regulator with XRE-family HTH domain